MARIIRNTARVGAGAGVLSGLGGMVLSGAALITLKAVHVHRLPLWGGKALSARTLNIISWSGLGAGAGVAGLSTAYLAGDLACVVFGKRRNSPSSDMSSEDQFNDPAEKNPQTFRERRQDENDKLRSLNGVRLESGSEDEKALLTSWFQNIEEDTVIIETTGFQSAEGQTNSYYYRLQQGSHVVSVGTTCKNVQTDIDGLVTEGRIGPLLPLAGALLSDRIAKDPNGQSHHVICINNGRGSSPDIPEGSSITYSLTVDGKRVIHVAVYDFDDNEDGKGRFGEGDFVNGFAHYLQWRGYDDVKTPGDKPISIMMELKLDANRQNRPITVTVLEI